MLGPSPPGKAKGPDAASPLHNGMQLAKLVKCVEVVKDADLSSLELLLQRWTRAACSVVFELAKDQHIRPLVAWGLVIITYAQVWVVGLRAPALPSGSCFFPHMQLLWFPLSTESELPWPEEPVMKHFSQLLGFTVLAPSSFNSMQTTKVAAYGTTVFAGVTVFFAGWLVIVQFITGSCVCWLTKVCAVAEGAARRL